MPSIEWNGAQIAEKMREATLAGADETLEAAAETARSDHNWQSQTGTAEESIQAQPASLSGAGVEGQFGSYGPDAVYFIWLETGSSSISADDTLRRAADSEFPKLAERIASNFGG